MGTPERDSGFEGSIPEIYDRHLVPLIFETHALDTATHVAATGASRVLEVAAGSGVLTRAMAHHLSPRVSITATDLNEAMLERGREIGTTRPISWRRAEASALPFDDAAFDAVVCHFGVMFFPDRAAAYAEARRVLAPGGTLLVTTWDRIEANEFAHVVSDAVAAALWSRFGTTALDGGTRAHVITASRPGG